MKCILVLGILCALALALPAIPLLAGITYNQTIYLRDWDYPDAIPGKIVLDESRDLIYVADTHYDGIHILDASTLERLDFLWTPGYIEDIDVSQISGKLYVISAGFGLEVFVYDLSQSYDWMYTLDTQGDDAQFVRVMDSIDKVFVTTVNPARIFRFEESFGFLEAVASPFASVSGIDLDEVEDKIYLCSEDGYIQSYEALTFNSGISVNGLNLDRIAVDPMASRIWANSNDSSEAYQFDYSNWFDATTWNHGADVTDLAVDLATSAAFLLLSSTNDIFYIDSDNGIESYYGTGNNPVALAVGVQQRRLFVSCVDDGVVDVFLLEGGEYDVPNITSVGMGIFVVDLEGDTSIAYVDVESFYPLVSVTANGAELAFGGGNLWYGEFPTDPGPPGFTTFEVEATNSLGYSAYNQGSYNRTTPITYLNRSLWETTIGDFWYQRQANVYGRVVSVNGTGEFRIQDGSHPTPLRIGVRDHGLSVGDFIMVRGQLYGQASDPVIISLPHKLTKIE